MENANKKLKVYCETSFGSYLNGGQIPCIYDRAWDVTCCLADGTVRESRISVTGGFSIVFR